jgi:putative ABC transport system substrate-binding protein
MNAGNWYLRHISTDPTGDQMKRRKFIALGGAAATWPLALHAQEPMPIIGVLDFATSDVYPQERLAFREGLREAGFIEGQNVAIEYLAAEGVYTRLPAMAAYLVRRKVAVIVAVGALAPARVAKAATSTIPIVFAMGGNPVKFGLVASLSRPGGNVTGVTSFGTELSGKRLELLCEMVPELTTIAYLTGGPGFVSFEEESANMLAAARAIGRQLIVVSIPSNLDIEVAFTSLVQGPAKALIVGLTPHLIDAKQKISELALLHKLPGIYPGPRWCVDGGLMSYSADYLSIYRQLASQYVGKILNGTKPADLPVQQPTTFQLAINLRTAKALGVTVPPLLLARADTTIE